MPQPLQPFLHDLVGQVAAPTQVWSPQDGQVVPGPDATTLGGLLHSDVVVLSRLEATVDGDRGTPVAHRSLPDGSTVFTAVLRRLDAEHADTPDPRVRLDRTRAVAPGRLDERLLLSSSLDVAIAVRVEVVLAAEATSVQAVRQGEAVAPVEVATRDQAATWSAGGIEVTVTAPDAALAVGGSRVVLGWDVTLPVRGSVELSWAVDLSETDPTVVPAPPEPYEALGVAVPGADPRLGPWLARSVADLDSLRLALPGSPGDVFYAAGAPWYFTLFGRDSLWAARLTLPLGVEVARGTLRTLARLQGRSDDPRTGEQPGKIPHELRREGFQLAGMTLPPLYYGTVDATPLWVCLLHDAWRAGLADDDVTQLLPPLEAALGWLTAQTAVVAGVEGFVRYVSAGSQGLANQGWKDSGDAVRFADGSFAEGAIALCEVQGYAYEAAVSGAALLEAFDRPGAEDLRAWAERLAGRFRAAFWCDPDGSGETAYPALALDGGGRRVDALTSNIGHLVGTGLLNLDEEWRVARRVTSPELDSGLGLRTMSTRDVAYAPLSYHCGSVWPHDTAIVVDGLVRAGLGEAAEPLVQGLLAAAEAFDQRLPELWSGEGAPVPYPSACKPQAWSAAAAVVVARRAGVFGSDEGPA